MRKRLGMAVVAVLLVVIAGLTVVASAPGSAARSHRAGADAAQVTRPALTPIQQLALVGGATVASRSVPHKGKKVGRVAGVCHLPI